MAKIHKFIKKDIPIVTDINSGAVHVADRLVYDILDHYPEMSDKYSIEKKLDGKYSLREIDEALKEIELLEKRGLLFSDDRYQDIARKVFERKDIKSLCLHVAHDCNMRCRYCFASQGDFAGSRILMREEVAFRAVDFLLEKSGSHKVLEIDFFGGEPLMNFEVVKAAVDYGNFKAKEAGKRLRYTITTNGLLLNDEIIDFINENMYNVVFSLDGRPEVNDRMRAFAGGKGTYREVVDKVGRAVEKRKDKMYFVRGTFTRYNLDFSEDAIHLADLGFKSISVEPVVEKEDRHFSIREEDLETIKKEYDKLFNEYVERIGTPGEFEFYHFKVSLDQGPCVAKRLAGCSAGNQYLAVIPEGAIYPCHQFVGDKSFVMGNVFDGQVNRETSEQFKEAHVYNKRECTQCWARFYCSGGCHANSHKLLGHINANYKIGCEIEKKRLECAIAVEVIKRLKEGEDDSKIQG